MENEKPTCHMTSEKRLIDAEVDSGGETAKIKTHHARIVVDGTAEKPYYSIEWFDPTKKEYYLGYSSYFIGNVFKWLEECFEIVDAPTVDAVEVADAREFAEDVAYQFGYYCQNGGRLHITHGGLSTLEEAFDILGWENPHAVPECECEIDGCHEHATCGAKTNDGYKRMCGRHFRERREGE